MYCKLPALLLALFMLTGCSLLRPGPEWQKPGATDADYEADLKRCKVMVYSFNIDGYVTKASVRRMHECMAAQGWRRAE
jgi:hypothetical protein